MITTTAKARRGSRTRLERALPTPLKNSTLKSTTASE